MKNRRKHRFLRTEFIVPGLTDRSERPTSHTLFAPLEKEKSQEEAVLRKRWRRARRRRRPAEGKPDLPGRTPA